MLAAFVTGAMVVLGVSGWQLLRGQARRGVHRLGPAGSGRGPGLHRAGDGDRRPPGPADGHPAADEDGRGRGGLPDQAGASFSLLTIGNLSGQPVFQIRIPHLLSLIATLSWNGTVDGITQVQNAEAARYGPGGYMPVLWVTY